MARIRWRRRGAWMWPAFLPLTIADGVIGTSLPPSGDGWNFLGAALFGAFCNLMAVVALSVPLRVGLRWVRRDLPKVVATDYAGTTTMCAISAVLLVAGLAHHSDINAQNSSKADAIERAQAYIGDRAPAEFRSNVQNISTFTIEAGSVYRMCVPNLPRTKFYCVVVHEKLPFPRSVAPDGSESNATLDQGTG